MMDVRSRSIADPDKRVTDRISKLRPEEVGRQTVSNLKQNGVDLYFETQNTVLRAVLAQPLLPGQTTELTLDFNGQVPVQIRRSGRNNKEGVDYSMAQWYPKLAAYDRHGKDGVPSDGRAAAGGFRTGGVHSFADADEIFQRFFGGRDPFAAFLSDDADSPFGRSPFGSVLGGSSVGGFGAGSGGRSNLLGSLHDEFLAGGCGGARFSQTQTTQTQTQFSSFSSSTSKSTFGGMGGSCTSSSQSISTSVENGVRVTRKMTTKTTADGQTTTSVEESRTTPDGRTETRTV
jgi:hypothetical protein